MKTFKFGKPSSQGAVEIKGESFTYRIFSDGNPEQWKDKTIIEWAKTPTESIYFSVTYLDSRTHLKLVQFSQDLAYSVLHDGLKIQQKEIINLTSLKALRRLSAPLLALKLTSIECYETLLLLSNWTELSPEQAYDLRNNPWLTREESPLPTYYNEGQLFFAAQVVRLFIDPVARDSTIRSLYSTQEIDSKELNSYLTHDSFDLLLQEDSELSTYLSRILLMGQGPGMRRWLRFFPLWALKTLTELNIPESSARIKHVLVIDLLEAYIARAKEFSYENYEATMESINGKSNAKALDYLRYRSAETLFTFAIGAHESTFLNEWLKNMEIYGHSLDDDSSWQMRTRIYPKYNREPTLEVIALRNIFLKTDGATTAAIYRDFLHESGSLKSFINYAVHYSLHKETPVSWYLALADGSPQEN